MSEPEASRWKSGLSSVLFFLFLSVLPACHPGGDDSGNPAVYVGAWTYADDTISSNCPAGDVTTGTTYPGGTLTVAQSGNGLQVTDRDGCNAMFTIDGSTATAVAGQMCTTDNGETVNITSWTIFVYDAQILWNQRTISRTSSAGTACNVSVSATVHQ